MVSKTWAFRVLGLEGLRVLKGFEGLDVFWTFRF